MVISQIRARPSKAAQLLCWFLHSSSTHQAGGLDASASVAVVLTPVLHLIVPVQQRLVWQQQCCFTVAKSILATLVCSNTLWLWYSARGSASVLGPAELRLCPRRSQVTACGCGAFAAPCHVSAAAAQLAEGPAIGSRLVGQQRSCVMLDLPDTWETCRLKQSPPHLAPGWSACHAG